MAFFAPVEPASVLHDVRPADRVCITAHGLNVNHIEPEFVFLAYSAYAAVSPLVYRFSRPSVPP